MNNMIMFSFSIPSVSTVFRFSNLLYPWTPLGLWDFVIDSYFLDVLSIMFVQQIKTFVILLALWRSYLKPFNGPK